MRRAAMKASWGMLTLPYSRIRFFPSFCFSSSLRFRVASPPLLPRLPFRVFRIARGLELRFALRRRRGSLRRRIRRCRFARSLAVGLLRRRLLGLGRAARLAGGEAFGGLGFVDRGAGAILLER